MTTWFTLLKNCFLLMAKKAPQVGVGLLFCLLPFASSAQTKPYFQQEVNYKIKVTLDDRKQTLTGNVEMEYINNSPDALSEIWMHLWGNAFKNRRTAFSKQKLKHQSGRFYFAEDSLLGYYKNLDFAVNGQKATWKFDRENPDIAVVMLPQPLAPGARLTLSTPFTLHIPASFSRLGHVGQSYQATQWYPKPAVYDNRGWHAMPYLDQGEFYSEFGNFDVEITLPDNYIVGATGMVQNASEIAFLTKKVAESQEKLREKITSKEDPFPVSSMTVKTLRYKAERVHDFAWFADKRFFVLRDTARLASGRTVDCWAMFTNSNAELWKQSAFYVRRSVEFYSEKVGEYPWPQATAVHSALSAGGGMEYPMVTVINDESSAKSLDEVITHEVGHNWFYGILASNERDHPFLDEGFNSYYEMRYMKQYWEGSSKDMLKAPKWLYKPAESGSVIENAYLLLAREHVATPPDSPAEAFQQFTYGVDVYMKTALGMAWLEQAVGTVKFDAAMQDYYRQWQFRHPYPEDVEASFKKSGLDADWFFQTMQTEKQADYALRGIQEENGAWKLEIENKGDLNAPFSVTAMQDGQPGATQWYPVSTEKQQIVNFPTTTADAFIIDYQHTMLDVDRKNNLRRTSGAFPGVEPLQVKLLAPVENPAKTTLGVLPWLGWNNYDKTMLGLLLYNPIIPSRKFQYYLAPGFGTASKQLVGLADLRYKLYPGGIFPKITLGVSAKSFDFDYNFTHAYYSKFYRVVPQIRVELATKGTANTFRHFLNFRTLFIGREVGQFDTTNAFVGKNWAKSTIFEVRYEAIQKRLPNPYHFTATLESQPDYRNRFDQPGNYVKGSLEWKQQFYYQQKRKVSARFFAGYFLQNSERNRGVEPVAFTLNPQGFNDYRFDEVYFGRSDEQGFRARQVSQTDGGLKAPFGSSFGGIIGNSNNYILAMNLKADLPTRLPWGIPLRPWFDIGYFDDATPIGSERPGSEQLLWSGGVMLDFFKGNLEIYFPLVNSKNLKERYCELSGGSNTSAIFCGGNYFKWISWSVNLGKLDPNRLLEDVVR